MANSKYKRTGPQCTEKNHLGFRCGHNVLEGLTKCHFHATVEEVAEAKAAKELALAAAREAARNHLPSPAILADLENSDGAQEFSRAVLQSLDFCEYVLEGLRARTIPPAILLRFMDYAEGWGKPTEKIEHTGDAVVTEVRRVVVRPREDGQDQTEELRAEDLDVPMIPTKPTRMH